MLTQAHGTSESCNAAVLKMHRTVGWINHTRGRVQQPNLSLLQKGPRRGGKLCLELGWLACMVKLLAVHCHNCHKETP